MKRLQMPPQLEAGEYRLFHPEYTSPLSVTVTQNDQGAWVYSFHTETEYPQVFGRRTYQGAAEDFWPFVYRSLSLANVTVDCPNVEKV